MILICIFVFLFFFCNFGGLLLLLYLLLLYFIILLYLLFICFWKKIFFFFVSFIYSIYIHIRSSDLSSIVSSLLFHSLAYDLMNILYFNLLQSSVKVSFSLNLNFFIFKIRRKKKIKKVLNIYIY